MGASELGRPGARKEYFLNKVWISNEQIRAKAAKTPKLAFSNKALTKNEQIWARAAKNPKLGISTKGFY